MNKIKILCLGDSLTEAYGIDKKFGWVHLLQNALKLPIINAGISGDTTSGMLARIERLLLEHKPTHLIILGGTNDLWFGLKPEHIISNIHAISRQAKYYQVSCLVGLPTPSFNLDELNFLNENYSERILSFQKALLTYCKSDEKIVINFSNNMTAHHFLEDGLHPNEKGQHLMFKNALNILKSII